jgi:hypothetical protein
MRLSAGNILPQYPSINTNVWDDFWGTWVEYWDVYKFVYDHAIIMWDD